MNRGAPTLMALNGTDAEGEPMWVVAFEWPELWKQHADDESKERQHLERFQLDYRSATGSNLYTNIQRPASDPPDFVAQRDERDVGVEMAQLLLSERAEIAAQFRQLRMRILSTDHNRFSKLRDHVVFVSFGDLADAKPPRTSGEVNAFLAELARYEPFVIEAAELPEQLDPRFRRRFATGEFTASRLTETPDSLFYRQLGFELALGFSTRILANEAWKLLERLAGDHDSPGVDDLVITAGGPTKDGISFPSDAVLAEAVLNAAETRPLALANVERVLLHVWQSGAIFVLHPGRTGTQRVG